VPQDPADVPAGEMLERIRKQREGGERAEKTQNKTQGGRVRRRAKSVGGRRGKN